MTNSSRACHRKNSKVIATNPRVRSKVDKEKVDNCDIKADSIKFLKMIDIARERNYNLRGLLTYKLTVVPFFLFKDGFMKKAVKSALFKELRDNLQEPALTNSHQRNACN